MIESRGFLLPLVLVSAASLATIALWTRGASPLLRVEQRIGEFGRLAGAHEVPVGALVALAWYDARRAVARTDLARVKALAEALKAADGDVVAAFDVLVTDDVDRRMTVDLMRRKTARWRRLRDS